MMWLYTVADDAFVYYYNFCFIDQSEVRCFLYLIDVLVSVYVIYKISLPGSLDQNVSNRYDTDSDINCWRDCLHR